MITMPGGGALCVEVAFMAGIKCFGGVSSYAFLYCERVVCVRVCMYVLFVAKRLGKQSAGTANAAVSRI